MSSTTPDWVLWEERLQHGAHWSGVVRRGTTLRVLTEEDGANVSMTFFNQEQPLERYNMADTLKAQHTAYLQKGHVCYSDMGRVMCSITDDSCGWHDTLGGVSDAQLVTRKYGKTRFQEQRNAYHKNGQDSLLNELAKHGLGSRDLSSVVNLFSKVVVSDNGAMQFVTGHATAGQFVDLRFEMHCLVAVSTCQHPLDPATDYQPRAIQLIAWRSGPAPRNDVCRNYCEENQRGFYNTEVLYR